jgi:hypothetical protein
VDSACWFSAGVNEGFRGVRWGASGTGAIELESLGTDESGYTFGGAIAVNNTGVGVGFARKYVNGIEKGNRAIRWQGPGTTATELGSLETNAAGTTNSAAYAINDAGTVVGYAAQYNAGTYIGTRAIRWEASGTTAIELGNLGTSASGTTSAGAYAINDAGTTVGFAAKYVSGADMGYRAVRWDISGTAATELGNLGTDAGKTNAYAYAVNDAGTAAGYARKYVAGADLGDRAVRWDACGTDVTELGNLGTNASGNTMCHAVTLNDVGTAVGYCDKYVSGVAKGRRAVRWDPTGTAATELGILGANTTGSTDAAAYAINNAGIAVGYTQMYDTFGTLLGKRATLWGLDGVAVDLNTLIDPTSGWTLTEARSISDTCWIEGVATYGTFVPGPGGMILTDTYERLFLMQVPEPATLALMALGGMAAMLRRRK